MRSRTRPTEALPWWSDRATWSFFAFLARQTRPPPRSISRATASSVSYHALPATKRAGRVEWPGKTGVTFSDALMAVRRWLWREWVFPQAGVAPVVQEPPEPVQELLLYGLAPAASFLVGSASVELNRAQIPARRLPTGICHSYMDFVEIKISRTIWLASKTRDE
jgi:hypothetical protein